MTTEFTASNGIRIKADPDGIMIQPHPSMPWRYMDGYCPGTDLDTAMAEWYRHRRDTELGRWRDPENPDHLVYQSEPYVQGYRRIAVVNERDMTSVHTFSEGAEQGSSDPKALTAQRYFAAHPEPKPWMDAAHEEVWEITANGDTGPALATTSNKRGQVLAFQFANGTVIEADSDEITTGRRIWPEETGDE